MLAMAADAGATVRLLGGLAIAKHVHTEVPAALRRSYPDIDLAVRRGDDRSLRGALQAGGYVPNVAFNSLRGDRRLLYYDEANDRQIDVFVGAFKMCHTLELDDRLTLDPATLAPADLLLTKLQVVEVEPKGPNRRPRVAALPRTRRRTHGRRNRHRPPRGGHRPRLGMVHDGRGQPRGPARGGRRAAGRRRRPRPGVERIDRIARALADAPKSLGWKARAKVGRRVVWYELPEEVRHGG